MSYLKMKKIKILVFCIVLFTITSFVNASEMVIGMGLNVFKNDTVEEYLIIWGGNQFS